MAARRRRASDHLPTPQEFDYDALFDALQAAYSQLVRYRSLVGSKSPSLLMADAAREHIGAFAQLTIKHNEWKKRMGF